MHIEWMLLIERQKNSPNKKYPVVIFIWELVGDYIKKILSSFLLHKVQKCRYDLLEMCVCVCV